VAYSRKRRHGGSGTSEHSGQIASSTTLTASHSRETACERSPLNAPILTQPKKPDPTPHAGNDPPAAFVGIGGRLQSERMAAFNRNPRPQSSESANSEFESDRWYFWRQILIEMDGRRFREA
jgi:hypothetical protein